MLMVFDIVVLQMEGAIYIYIYLPPSSVQGRSAVIPLHVLH